MSITLIIEVAWVMVISINFCPLGFISEQLISFVKFRFHHLIILSTEYLITTWYLQLSYYKLTSTSII